MHLPSILSQEPTVHFGCLDAILGFLSDVLVLFIHFVPTDNSLQVLGQVVSGSHNAQGNLISFLIKIVCFFFIVETDELSCDVVETYDDEFSQLVLIF